MSNNRQIGIALVAFGGLLMLAGAFAYSYQESHIEVITQGYYVNGIEIVPPISRTVTTTPFKDYAVSIILASLASFGVGFGFFVYRPENSPSEPIDNSKNHDYSNITQAGVRASNSVILKDGVFSQIRCGNCGTVNDFDAVYCKKCAIQLH
jgi:hypothetical protein